MTMLQEKQLVNKQNKDLSGGKAEEAKEAATNQSNYNTNSPLTIKPAKIGTLSSKQATQANPAFLKHNASLKSLPALIIDHNQRKANDSISERSIKSSIPRHAAIANSASSFYIESISVSQEQLQQQQQNCNTSEYKLSKRRWLILFGLCVFSFLNGIVSSSELGRTCV